VDSTQIVVLQIPVVIERSWFRELSVVAGTSLRNYAKRSAGHLQALWRGPRRLCDDVSIEGI